jgi:ATP-binding cassette subfamily C (CFTR/MRP) protein 1
MAHHKLLEVRGGESGEEQNEVKAENWRRVKELCRVMFAVGGRKFLVAGVLKLLGDVCTLAMPVLQTRFISMIEGGQGGTAPAILMSFVLLLVPLVSTFVMNAYFFRTFSVGLDLKTTLYSLIFRKSSRLSNVGRGACSQGQIINFLSDAEKINMLAQYGHVVWSGSLQIVVCIALLINLLGPSALASIGIIILLIPIQTRLGNLVTKVVKNVNTHTDKRVKFMGELLTGIRIVKLYAWERPFAQYIKEARSDELGQLYKSQTLASLNNSVMSLAPAVISAACLSIYAATGHTLIPAKVFPALTLLQIIRFPILFIPMLANAIVEANVALGRIAAFLAGSEVPVQDRSALSAPGVRVVALTTAWKDPRARPEPLAVLLAPPAAATPASGAAAAPAPAPPVPLPSPPPPAVSRVSLTAGPADKVVVIGAVGSGKSSLLQSLLGELPVLSGSVAMTGSVAYVAQQPWLMNATIQGNVLFGKPLDKDRYAAVMTACALDQDMAVLPSGHLTEVGERGVTLSGGQKQRIALARAVYSEADVYILDDPLSAVDGHTGHHLVTHVLSGLLKDKCVIIATNQISLMRDLATWVICLEGGAVSTEGTFEDLVESGCPNFAAAGVLPRGALQPSAAAEAEKKTETEKPEAEKPEGDERESSADDVDIDLAEDDNDPAAQPSTAPAAVTTSSSKLAPAPSAAAVEAGKHLVQAEEQAVGAVKFAVYKQYAVAAGVSAVLLTLGIFMVCEAVRVLTDWWVSVWTSAPDAGRRVKFYIGIFLGLTALQAVFYYLRNIAMAWTTLRSARVLHDGMLERILRAPVAFFDVTPTGRLLNRFSKDISALDKDLLNTWRQFVMTSIFIVGSLSFITFSNPLFAVPLVVMAATYLVIMQYFRPTARELKRIDSTAKSPVLSFIGEVLAGSATIRAFGAVERMDALAAQLLDAFNRPGFSLIAVNRWLALRLEVLGAFLVFSVAITAASSRGSSAAVVGLSLTYILTLTSSLQFALRLLTDVETSMNSVERVLEYSRVESEPALHVPGAVAAAWPPEGRIAFRGVSVRYRRHLPLVLDHVSFETRPGEKIGVVGRTGSGKSTLTLALFRIMELEQGSITIDGVDISKIGVEDLRSKLSIIPQDPVLFSASVRKNLDPFSLETDESLLSVVESIRLKPLVDSLGGLEGMISEGGDNISCGQRQLICLARALLRQSRIVVLDEATASVDAETDAFIQSCVRRNFAGSTLITIAHRLATIADFDRVLVLDNGHVAEFDTPRNLLNDKDSLFFGLAAKLGPSAFEHIKGVANLATQI